MPLGTIHDYIGLDTTTLMENLTNWAFSDNDSTHAGGNPCSMGTDRLYRFGMVLHRVRRRITSAALPTIRAAEFRELLQVGAVFHSPEPDAKIIPLVCGGRQGHRVFIPLAFVLIGQQADQMCHHIGIVA